jgi:hypothetical protein
MVQNLYFEFFFFFFNREEKNKYGLVFEYLSAIHFFLTFLLRSLHIVCVLCVSTRYSFILHLHPCDLRLALTGLSFFSYYEMGNGYSYSLSMFRVIF